MAKLEFDLESCKSCGYCVHFCPKKVLKIGDHVNAKGYKTVSVADEERCIGCAICAVMCPDSVIQVYR